MVRATPVQRYQDASAYRRALREVALDLLRKGPGQTATTAVQLQNQLGVGSGTIQKAIRELVDTGAVVLHARGHQGTLIVEYDPPQLWRAADLGQIRLLAAPPGAVEVAAVVVELRRQLAEINTPMSVDFIRGATRRIERVRGGVRCVAFLSRGAAESLGMLGTAGVGAIDLGPDSYYSAKTLVVVERQNSPAPKRIARDPASYDHTRLTEAEFPLRDGYEYVDCDFADVPAAVLAGRADAGIWRQVVTAIPPRLAGLELRYPAAAAAAQRAELSHGVLLWHAEFEEIGAVLRLLDLAQISSAIAHLTEMGPESPEVREAVPWL